MGITIPKIVNPFSREFKDTFKNMAIEISRLSEAYADLSRAQKQVFTRPQGGGSDICFFQITDAHNLPQYPLAGNDTYTEPRMYTGTLYVYDATAIPDEVTGEFGRPRIEEDGAAGWDMSLNMNTPITSPANANLYADPLTVGTVVIAQKLNPTSCIFSSTMPRISVECTG